MVHCYSLSCPSPCVWWTRSNSLLLGGGGGTHPSPPSSIVFPLFLLHSFSVSHYNPLHVGFGCAGWFREERVRVGQSLRDATPFLPFYREYAKRGIPAGHRPVMWSTLLGLGNLGTKERAYFRMLSNDVDKKEYLVCTYFLCVCVCVCVCPNIHIHVCRM